MASTQPTPTACVENRDFYRAWLLWTCLGVWHGVVCFGVPLRAFAGGAAVGMAGWHASLEELGSAVMTAVVITVTLRVCVMVADAVTAAAPHYYGTLCTMINCIHPQTRMHACICYAQGDTEVLHAQL